MTQHKEISLTVNGAAVTRSVAPRMTLVDFLRHELGLTGSHVGCEHGICGACTVRLDGVVVRGCLTLAVQADGATVETIEGATETGAVAALQEAFHQCHAVQCGFCTPGFILTAAELLQRDAHPSREAIRAYLSGNFCRCTGYHAIIDAVEAAAEKVGGAA